MKNFIRISIILLVLSLCFALVACGNDNGKETEPETTAPVAPESTPVSTPEGSPTESTPVETEPEGPDAAGTDELGYSYTLNLDGESYAISGYAGEEASITLPTEFNELPVTVIGDFAFANNAALTSVTIPGSITTIGLGAFSGCENLPSINIPETVEVVHPHAFASCTKLTSVTVPGTLGQIPQSMFRDCTALKTVVSVSQDLPLPPHRISLPTHR